MYNTNNHMKSFLKIISLLFILTTFLLPAVASAQTVLTPLTATVNGTVITATLTGVSAVNVEKVDIFVQKDAFPATTLCPSATNNSACLAVQPTKEVVGTTIKWTIKSGIAGKTLYNIRAEGKNGYAFISNVVKVETGMETIDAAWPLTSTTDGANAWIKGKLNNPNPADFKAKLEYSITPLKTDGNTTASTYGPKLALKSNTNNAVYGIEADGTYYYRLTDLTAGTTYSIRQTIESKNGAREIKVGVFNSKNGIIPENSVNQALSDAQRSYSLLAPLPGLNVILDNDLCREYVTQGKPVPGGSCDNQISYFINLIIRFLIGLSVVVLVVKIIFEGYQYMVTDIPFIKASAKSKLFESFFGLLLALASFLILNTINPRLVSSDISIAGIDIDIDNPEGTGDFDFESVKRLSGNGKISCPGGGGQSSINSIAQSFVGKVSYNQNRRNSTINNDIYLDCSSYVATVLDCAGYQMNRSSTTYTIFNGNGAETINKATTDYSKNVVNGVELKSGDLIGWPSGSKSGHVLIYIGNGNLAEVHGPTYPSKGGKKDGAARVVALKNYSHQNKFTHIKRLR